MSDTTSRTEVLRIVIDPSGATAGAQDVRRAQESITASTRQNASQQEIIERESEQRRSRRREQELQWRESQERTAQWRMAEMEKKFAPIRAREAVMAEMEAREREYKDSIARIKLAQAQGFMSGEEAAEQGRIAASEYNTALATAIERAGAEGAFRGRAGSAAFVQITDSLKNVDEESRRASIGMGLLRQSAASMAAQAAGVHPVVGRLANVVGQFALGATTTTLVLAGLAAIGFGLRKIGEDARKAKEDAEAAIGVLERLLQRQRDGLVGEINRGIVEAQSRMQVLGREIERLEANEMADRRVRKLRAEYAELKKLVESGEAEIQRIVQGEIEKNNDAHERQQEERRRKEKEALSERERALREAQAAEDRYRNALVAGVQAGVASAENVVELRTRQMELRDATFDTTRGIVAQVEALQKLIPVTAALRAENERLIRQTVNRGGGLDLRLPGVGAVTPVNVPDADQIRTDIETADGARRAAEASLLAWEEAAKGIQRTLVDGFDGAAEDILRIAKRLVAELAAVQAMETLGLNKMLEDLRSKGVGGLPAGVRYGGAAIAGVAIGTSTGSGAAGLAGGIASGALLAGPVGAVIGGVTGLASGLLEQGERARKAEQMWRDALAGVNQSLREFVEDATGISRQMQDERAAFQRASQINQQLREGLSGKGLEIGGGPITSIEDIERRIAAAEEFARTLERLDQKEGARAMREYVEEMERLREATEQVLAVMRERREEEERNLVTSLEVRRLRAEGDGPEAERVALEQRQQAEALEALRAGYSAATLELMDYVHALERQELAAKQAAEAMERARRTQDFANDLLARELRLGGDDVTATFVELQLARQRELEAAEELVRAGIITAEMFERLAVVLDEEIARAIEEMERRREQQATDFRSGLAEREAAAAGDEQLALRIRLTAQMERELAAARELERQGIITADEVERLARVLGIELAESLEAAARAAEEAARAFESSIEVDWLFAMGRDQEAETQRFIEDWTRRWNEAVEMGLGEDVLRKLEDIRDAELARIEQRFAGGGIVGVGGDRRDASTEIMRSSVTAISEVSAQRIVDISLSQLTVQQQMQLHLQQIELNTRGGVTVSAAGSTTRGGGITVQVFGNVYGPGAGRQLAQEILPHLNTGLGQETERDARLAGQA